MDLSKPTLEWIVESLLIYADECDTDTLEEYAKSEEELQIKHEIKKFIELIDDAIFTNRNIIVMFSDEIHLGEI